MFHKALPEWVKVSKKRFDTIKNKVQNAKNNNLQARPLGNPINFTKSSKFIQVMAHVEITSEEALKKIISIRNDICEIISQKTFDTNHAEG